LKDVFYVIKSFKVSVSIGYVIIYSVQYL